MPSMMRSLSSCFDATPDVAQDRAGELGEEALDEVEPGTVLGREGEARYLRSIPSLWDAFAERPQRPEFRWNISSGQSGFDLIGRSDEVNSFGGLPSHRYLSTSIASIFVRTPFFGRKNVQ
jgi:hypothetical protein